MDRTESRFIFIVVLAVIAFVVFVRNHLTTESAHPEQPAVIAQQTNH